MTRWVSLLLSLTQMASSSPISAGSTGHDMQVILSLAVRPQKQVHPIDRSLSVAFTPCLVRTRRPGGGEQIRLGRPLLDQRPVTDRPATHGRRFPWAQPAAESAGADT